MLIFWDIDGTLMHCGADGTKALNETFSELYGIRDAFTRGGIGSSMDSAIIARIFAANGIENEDPRRIVDVYVRNLREILSADEHKAVLPGAEKLLCYVKQREGWFNLLLTSNLYEGAVAKLSSVGLWEYFSESPAGGFGDAHKEKWEALEDAVGSMERRLGKGMPRDEIWLIGDSVYDIHTAKRLGVRHIAVATGFTHRRLLEAEQPEHLVNDLSDFQSIIDIFQYKR